ncbi:MAG: acylphosphatase [Gammaproteobacteria bacterium]|nr:acylphosphatase [Gammaproteobacteria bacterium]MYJ53128.1 acylphosphatase [Gammaproteobacteria bacterium]
MTRTVSIRVFGRVQGVGFRYSAMRRAVSLFITGWIRNHEHGHVEGVIQGGEEEVAAMLDWLREGPRHARVTETEFSETDGECFDAFRIL